MPGPHPDAPKPDCLPCPTCGYDLSALPPNNHCPECGPSQIGSPSAADSNDPRDATTAKSEPTAHVAVPLLRERDAITLVALRTFAICLALSVAAIAINLATLAWGSEMLPNTPLDSWSVFRASSALVGIPSLILIGSIWLLSSFRILGHTPRLRWWLRAAVLFVGFAVALLVAHRATTSSINQTLPQTPVFLRTVNMRNTAIYALAATGPVLVGLILALFATLADRYRAPDIRATCWRSRIWLPVILAGLTALSIAADQLYDAEITRRSLAVTRQRTMMSQNGPSPFVSPGMPMSAPPDPDALIPDWFTLEVIASIRIVLYISVSLALIMLFLASIQLHAIIQSRTRTHA